jgi:glycosyltransferase involved in cell wall biosynthesis
VTVRVLHVTPYFAPALAFGGPPRSILGLCRSLRRAGVEAAVFTTTASGRPTPLAVPEADTVEGVPVRYFPHAVPRGRFGARGLAAALAADVPRQDLVHVHGLWHLPGWLAARRARAARVPYVVSPRGMLDAAPMSRRAGAKRLAYWLVERRHLSRAALLHASSDHEARSLAGRGLRVPVVTLPNGVDVPDAGALARGTFRRRLGLDAGVPLIAFVGRVHPTKRLDLLAAAFARVREREPRARLAIAGPDEGGHRRRVEPLFAASAGAVHWTGELGERDTWAVLGDADALVLCSDSESFGRAVLEALAAGVPVVVTRTCPWGLVEAAGCGFWVPQDASDIAAALLRLLADRERARAMGQRGRALAQATYAWDGIARAMATHYRAVVARGAAPVNAR